MYVKINWELRVDVKYFINVKPPNDNVKIEKILKSSLTYST